MATIAEVLTAAVSQHGCRSFWLANQNFGTAVVAVSRDTISLLCCHHVAAHEKRTKTPTTFLSRYGYP
jgi:hypothetical protein